METTFIVYFVYYLRGSGWVPASIYYILVGNNNILIVVISYPSATSMHTI